MYRFSEIQTIHLEITAKCNASCPMCGRNISGGKVNPQLPLTELRLSDVQAIIPPSLVRQLKRLYMCGNFGDPAVAKDTLEVFRYLREQNSTIKLEMFSNGAIRSSEWWAELAGVIDKCHFAIDGLEDTNGLYRRGTQWARLMENVQAYLRAGGIAVWDYIVFRHNEHQVEEARKLSQSLGFAAFNVKKTARFFSNTKIQGKESQPVLNTRGELEYEIEKPLDSRYWNTSLQDEQVLAQKYGSLHSYLEQSSVDCKVAREKSLYISAEGLVFPCCWTANQLYLWYRRPKSTQIWSLIERLPGGLRSLNALQAPISEIVEGSFFQRDLPVAWSQKSFDSGKLLVCSKTCSAKGFDPFRAQF